ncbi:MAG: hypothetical protein K8S14_02335 [Actinomycetia bacterium]|nr:hypothetical protein [Actinomycetes bacterium]
MHNKAHPVKNNSSFKMSGNIKFYLIIALAAVLIIAGIILSILNNMGLIGRLDPTVIKDYKISGKTTDIFTERDYAYLTYNIYENNSPEIPTETGLQILNISYKEDPQLITDYKTPMGADCVFVKGNFAYIGGRGLQIVEISDKENPAIVGICAMDLEDSCIYIEEKYAYIAGYEYTEDCYRLYIIDITDKENPAIAASCAMDDKVLDIDVKGNYAYLANWNSGLLIIDISDKKNPEIAGTCDAPITTSVFVQGDYAYIIDYGFQIIDINDKKNPNLLGNCPIPGSGYSIYIIKNHAYIVNGSSHSNENDTAGLQIIDINDKENPAIAASCVIDMLQLDSLNIHAERNYAYIASGQTGLQIIKIIN